MSLFMKVTDPWPTVTQSLWCNWGSVCVTLAPFMYPCEPYQLYSIKRGLILSLILNHAAKVPWSRSSFNWKKFNQRTLLPTVQTLNQTKRVSPLACDVTICSVTFVSLHAMQMSVLSWRAFKQKVHQPLEPGRRLSTFPVLEICHPEEKSLSLLPVHPSRLSVSAIFLLVSSMWLLIFG